MELQDLKQDLRELNQKLSEFQRTSERLNLEFQVFAVKSTQESTNLKSAIDHHAEHNDDERQRLHDSLERLTRSIDLLTNQVTNLKSETDMLKMMESVKSQQIADMIAGTQSVKELYLIMKQEVENRLTKLETKKESSSSDLVTWISTNKKLVGLITAAAAGGSTTLAFWEQLLKLLGK